MIRTVSRSGTTPRERQKLKLSRGEIRGLRFARLNLSRPALRDQQSKTVQTPSGSIVGSEYRVEADFGLFMAKVGRSVTQE